MAQVETWRSSGRTSSGGGVNSVPWPYQQGAAGRGLQQLGADLERLGSGMVTDYVKTKATEEISDTELDLIKEWDDYKSWAFQNRDKPDIDGQEFSRRMAAFEERNKDRFTTGPSRTYGAQLIAKYKAEKVGAAKEAAVQQQRTNATAAFRGNIEWLPMLPDQPASKQDIYERQQAIVLAFDDAVAAGLIQDDDNLKVERQAALRDLWRNAVTNAMKHDPASVNDLLADDQNFLTPSDEASFRSVMEQQDAYAKRQMAANAKAQLDMSDAQMTARVLKTQRGAAAPAEIVTPALLENMMMSGQISEVTGRMLWDRLTATKEPTAEDQKKAVARMVKARQYLMDGHMSQSDYKEVYDANAANMTVTQADKWRDPGVDDVYNGYRQDAYKLAMDSISPLFPVKDKREEMSFSAKSGLDEAVSEVMEELDEYIKEKSARDQKVVPEKEFRDKARSIVNRVYQREFYGKNPPKRDWWGGGFKGEPTAEELRTMGTREAFEKGRELGYW